MKTALSLAALMLATWTVPASAQGPGAPTYPGAGVNYGSFTGAGGGYNAAMPPPAAGSGLYNGYPPIASSLPPPNYTTPSYGGPTMVEPAPQPTSPYSFQQPVAANGWGAAQQSIGASMLNYSYLEAGYRYVDPQGGELDGSHGVGVTLVMDLPTIFFLKASLNWTSGSGKKTVNGAANAEYSLSTISIGGGAYMAITNQLHFVGEMGLIYANFDADGINRSYTEAGIYIRPSLRYQMVDWLELQAGVTVSSTSDYDSKLIDIGAYFRVMPQLDLNLGMDFGDVNRTLRAGARLRW